MNRPAQFAKCMLLCVCTLVAVSPIVAEVGVIVRPDGTASSMIFHIIVDDPDPITVAWTPYHVGNPNFDLLNINGTVAGDHKPSLLMDSGPGYPIASWASAGSGGFDLVISRFDGAGWTAPATVADSADNELDPYLVVDPSDGSIHVLYWIHDAVPRVMHTFAPADLSSWSTPRLVSDPGVAACRPSAAFVDGVLHVAFEMHSSGFGNAPRQIAVAEYDGEGFSNEILATTQYAMNNWPEIHFEGQELWIDWIDAVDGMAWTRRLPSGSWDAIEVEHFDTIEERDFRIRGLIRRLALD